MTTEHTATETLEAARRLSELATAAAGSAVESASRLTEGGKLIDEHQVHAERIAQLATEARAADELVRHAEAQAGAGKPDGLAEEEAFVFAAESLHKARVAVEVSPEEYG